MQLVHDQTIALLDYDRAGQPNSFIPSRNLIGQLANGEGEAEDDGEEEEEERKKKREKREKERRNRRLNAEISTLNSQSNTPFVPLCPLPSHVS